MMVFAEAESRGFHLLLSTPFCSPILKPHLKHKNTQPFIIHALHAKCSFAFVFREKSIAKTFGFVAI